MDLKPPPPPLVSAPRITTLIASLFVALSSGTNYVYSAYSPQLGAKLGISHTKLNIVALAGNVGVYSSGPIWGRIVDTRGPKILLACGFVFLLVGYSGMRYLYDAGLPAGVTTLSLLEFIVLVMFSFMTGAGGNGGLTSSVNSTAKTFPDQARASTTGLVISGFGLSAFFFSSISHIFFAGNTSAFLLVLALGTSFPMIMGFFLVRPIPLPTQEGYEIVNDDHLSQIEDPEILEEVVEHHNRSHTHLLDHDFVDGPHQHYVRSPHVRSPRDRGHGAEPPIDAVPDLERNPELEYEVADPSSFRHRSLSRGAAMALDTVPNMHGKKLLKSGDFWLLFSILSILSGTGLMYINNVGSMSQALYAYKNSAYDEVEASTWQATQVSTVSVMNFSGRIIIGLISDFAKNKFEMPRSYSLILVSSAFFLSQVLAVNVRHIAHLWIVSACVGLAYGSAFSLLPTVCLEWFGMPHFSENWGYLSMSPMVAGNIFSIIFGRNLDRHDNKLPLAHASSLTSAPQCIQGAECYVDTLYLTTAATFLSILLSFWAGYRDRRKIKKALAKRGERRRLPVYENEVEEERLLRS